MSATSLGRALSYWIWTRVPRGISRSLRRLKQRVPPFRPVDTAGCGKRFLYVYDVDRNHGTETCAPQVEFRELAPEKAEEYERGIAEDAGPTTRRAPDGEACMVGFLNGRAVYRARYRRTQAERMRDLPPEWRPRGPLLFLHDGFTDPAYRGRGIHTAAIYWMLDRARGSGVAHAVCVVRDSDIAARRAVERVGFQRLGAVE